MLPFPGDNNVFRSPNLVRYSRGIDQVAKQRALAVACRRRVHASPESSPDCSTVPFGDRSQMREIGGVDPCFQRETDTCSNIDRRARRNAHTVVDPVKLHSRTNLTNDEGRRTQQRAIIAGNRILGITVQWPPSGHAKGCHAVGIGRRRSDQQTGRGHRNVDFEPRRSAAAVLASANHKVHYVALSQRQYVGISTAIRRGQEATE